MSDSTSRITRRSLLGLGGGAAAALALAACGSDSGGSSKTSGATGSANGAGAAGSAKGSAAGDAASRTLTDAYGRKVKIKGTPQKIVALSEPTIDALLALGITPIAVTAGRGQKGAPTYLADKVGKAPVVATVATPDLEKIAALQPDLILLDETVGAKKSVDELAAIAPTFVSAKLGEDWTKAFLSNASAVGKTAEAKKWLSTFDSDVQATKGKLGANKGASVSVIRWTAGKIAVVGQGKGHVGSTIEALGLTRPKNQQGAGPGHSVPISMEKLDTIDGDWLFFGTLTDKADAQKAYADAQKVPGWSKLKVQQKKHVVPIAGSAWNSAGGPTAARIVLDDLTKELT